MAIDIEIKEEKFSGHLTEHTTDDKYSKINYSIYTFIVDQPNDKDFDTDISYLMKNYLQVEVLQQPILIH